MVTGTLCVISCILHFVIFGKDGQDFGRLFRGYYRVVVIVVRVVVIGAGGVLI